VKIRKRQERNGYRVTFEEFQKQYGIHLNAQQEEAVKLTEGPVLLLAVPGSGKTTAVVTRLAYMIFCKGIAPERILTLTYTAAATRDMADRFSERFGAELAQRLEFRTINGICARVIYFYGRQTGREAFRLVTDEKEILHLLAEIYQQVEGGYATENDRKTVRTLITYIKNMMLTEEEIRRLDDTAQMKISAIYQRYHGEMRKRGFMDYDDQMAYAYTILRRSPRTLQYFRSCYPYLCVDEAQDTSRIQHALIALLAGKQGNLFMVGDEDQSIYGFRAAYPQALLQFEQEHPGAKVLLMEENFRSARGIVQAADAFIQKNILRHQKKMRAHRTDRGIVRAIEVGSRYAQYSYLVKAAANCGNRTAVLYRDNESMLPLADMLERNGIPYQVKNADPGFFTSRIVTDIRQIIQFARDPENTELFLQIYYKMGTYLSKEKARAACSLSRERQIPVLDAAVRFLPLTSGTEKSVRHIRSQLQVLLTDSADQGIRRIIRDMGYAAYLDRAGINDNKLYILRSLSYGEASPESLLARLDELAWILRHKENDPGCPFLLSTIHSSKGLEYDTVYLLDVADGIFPESIPLNPKQAKKEELEAYEEERRLFYVGVTRAKNRLYLFRQKSRPSLFIRELMKGAGIPAQGKTEGTAERGTSGTAAAGIARPAYVRSSAAGRSFHGKPKETFEEFRAGIDTGGEVRHRVFGTGEVMAVTEDAVLIRFADQERKFLLRVLYEGNLLHR
jgi:DNA helicase-2/ATP-dependent DNA helicase PcrA